MALIQPPMMVHGGVHPARAMRMMIRDLARGSSGVTEGNDLRVSPLTTPGAGVRVGDGSAVVRGASWAQGSYTQYNVGDAVVPIAPTGASARSDLVTLRVEDPEYEGTRDPLTQDIGYFHVVSGVSASTTAPPAGMTAIPLARIDVPSNTATITSAMIKDLRSIANPRKERSLYTASPSGDQNWAGNPIGTFVAWPPAARWNITVPPWATTVRIVLNIAGVQVLKGGIWAHSAWRLGVVQGQSVTAETGTTDGSERIHLISADTRSIPAAMRGTVQPLNAMIALDSDQAGVLQADVVTTAICDVDFSEGVV
ncbi:MULTISPECIES: hypothetical protein [unclassified Streptomyces]|uniref:hypothetical protein n=1 Tax=unclassified Streptomyces TaxID=2593676 RepID=UPI0006AD993B|nr:MULTISPECIES: hypothetical protein [unclassified Streptomyces]KOX33032.1 hypothetical protein ADL06_09810 [Streptomyces sp. NRRL F-6491]KOX49532.1 hypothetical protein ADL08_08505 [Streptomyces sp. NRRL F-6492]